MPLTKRIRIYSEEQKINNRKKKKEWRLVNKNHEKEYKIKWNKENPGYHKKYHNENKERENLRRKTYYNLHKKEENKRKLDKINADPQLKLRSILRIRINKALKNRQKIGSAVRDLGCSIEDFKWWLEFWWEDGMNWNNYGHGRNKWTIDHIKPLSSFDLTNKEQFLKATNYKNLQPMWFIDNMVKSNK